MRAGIRARTGRAQAAFEAALGSRWVSRLAGSPRRGLTISFGLHTIVILSTLIAWPSVFPAKDGGTQSFVPIELVSIGNETNITPQIREQLPLPSSNMQVAPAPPPSEAEALPAFEMKLFPQKPPPEGAPLQRPSEVAGTNTRLAAYQTPASGPKDAAITGDNVKGAGDQNAMTMTLPDALRNQIARCWQPPQNGLPQPALAISYKLFFNPDGSVSQPPQLVGGAANPELQAVTEAVRRAIYTCAPYSLPPSRYASWRAITLIFDPRMLSNRLAAASSPP